MKDIDETIQDKFKKVNKKIFRPLYIVLGSITLIFLLLMTLVIPILTRQEEYEVPVKKEETTELGNPDDFWIYPELEPYEIIKAPTLNHTKFWQVLKKHVFWNLEVRNPTTGEWINQTQLLNINRNYTNNNTCKISMNFTTLDNGQNLDWRITLAIDEKVKQYLNKSGDYEYTLSFKKNNWGFNLTYNWSDMLNYSGLIFKHGVKNVSGNQYFWWRVRRNNIPPNYYVELDPEYVVNTHGSADINLVARRQPAIRNSTGELYIAYYVTGVVNDIYIANSSDGGITWNNVLPNEMDVKDSRDGTLVLGDDDRVHLVFRGMRGSESYYNVRYSNSTDWNDVRNVTADASILNANYNFIGSSIDSNNIIHITGERPNSGTNSDDQVFYVNITDNGDTIGTKTVLTDEDTGNDDDFDPVIVTADNDILHIFYTIEDYAGNNKDAVAHMMSSDNGDTWTGWLTDIYYNDNLKNNYVTAMVDKNNHLVSAHFNDGTSDGVLLAYNDSTGWDVEDIDTTSVSHFNIGLSCVNNNDSDYVFSNNRSVSDFQIELNTNFSGTWTDWQVVGSNTEDDMYIPCAISNHYPVIDSLEPCIPETGYALFYCNFTDNNLMYKPSDDLTWQTSVGKTWQSQKVWNTTLVNNTFIWQSEKLWNTTLTNTTFIWNSEQVWNTSLVNNTFYWNSEQLWNTSLTNLSVSWHSEQTWNTTLTNTTFTWISEQLWNTTLVNNTFFWNSENLWNTTLINNTFFWDSLTNWNTTLTNLTWYWNSITNWNTTLINNTFFWISQTLWNTTLTNTTFTWQPITTWNTTLTNNTFFWNSENIWNTTLKNTSAVRTWQPITTWNTTLVNNTFYWNSEQLWNTTLTNYTWFWKNIDTWNTTLVNNTFYWISQNIWNTTLTNVSNWQSQQTWNTTLTNTTWKWQTINNWNTTLVNQTLNWNSENTWNTTLVNSTAVLITVSNEYPLDNSINIPLQPTMFLTINHSDGLEMTAKWYYGPQGSENNLLGEDTNIFNSTQSELNWNASNRFTDYYWRLQVNDTNGNYENYTYNFKTEGFAGGGSAFSDDSTAIAIAAGALIFSMFGLIALFEVKKRRRRRRR
jgi:hypothetical protein